VLLQMGDLETAAQWADTIAAPEAGPLDPALEYDHLTLARVWLAQGRTAEARALLARLLPPAEAAGRLGRAIEILALQAATAWSQHDTAEAHAALARALALGEPEGFVRSFLDEGEPMRAALRDWRLALGQQAPLSDEQQRLASYADRLLAAFPTPGGAAPTPAAPPMPAATPAGIAPLLEPLRERELEVLRLIAAGYTNPEIANQLVLGLSTIKTHINHLFQKLGVSSRTQAIARARALGLLNR
jgi:LuxR family maltose regulon positive regulatory protein